MAELLGILLALALTSLAWLVLRLLRSVRRGLARLRHLARPGRWRLSVARALNRSQAARIAELTAELERTRLALRLAERDRARGHRPDDRFLRAKRAFALRFHPDRWPRPGLERTLRRAIFQEFWAELRRIERG
jgi:hypothetical protein